MVLLFAQALVQFVLLLNNFQSTLQSALYKLSLLSSIDAANFRNLQRAHKYFTVSLLFQNHEELKLFYIGDIKQIGKKYAFHSFHFIQNDWVHLRKVTHRYLRKKLCMEHLTSMGNYWKCWACYCIRPQSPARPIYRHHFPEGCIYSVAHYGDDDALKILS